MAKQKRKKRQQRKSRLKESIKFEIYGLSLLAFSLLALIQPGAFGEILRAFFRFLAGSWDFLLPLSLLGLSVYLMLKRSWPTEWHYRWTGIVVFIAAILIMNHLRLIESVLESGQIEQQSVLLITWNLFWEDVSADVPVQLGGGMIGAVLFGTLNTLFASSGTMIIVTFMYIIAFLLLIGLSFQDMYRLLVKAGQSIVGWLQQRRSEWQEMIHKDDTSGTGKEAGDQSFSKKRSKRKQNQEAEVVEAGDPSSRQSQPSATDLEIYDFTEVAYEQEEMDFPEFKNEAQTVAGHEQGIEGRTTTKRISMRKEGEQPSSAQEQTSHDGEAVSFQEQQSGSRQGVVSYGDEDDNYQLPPFSFLKKQPRNKHIQKQDMKSRARKLEQTLESFGVNAQVTQVHRGPAVTRYEVHPAVGVKVSRVVNLADDIALALAAKGIRIEAPIPGKSAIGIEVPNDDVSMVTFREVLESSSFHESKSKLSIALGRDISGEPIVAHLNKMPHLLVAGATGSGKSVCVNGMIASILYKAKPHEVKFMMIDPKMVELNVYNGIPHLLTPVVTDPKKAALALKKVVAEMERRYELFADSGTRNIEGYNDLIRKQNESGTEEKKPQLPYIVVIIDELADLMMVAPGDVEDAIIRIAQMARAAGIHLLIATQRPSVDVITGIIKANIPSRIAFGVSSQTDSRTILDSGGAEKLLGKGDMLFLPVGASKTLRIQGAFISDDEVEKLVEHCIAQQKASYHEEMIPKEGEESRQQDEIEDELYPEAVQLIIRQGHASVSMLQRRFRIGYTRAARLIDAMEARGIVGPYEGSKPREVLVSEDESHIS